MKRKKKILVASEDRKSESSNSSVWDELKFESNKFITDKGNGKIMQHIKIRSL